MTTVSKETLQKVSKKVVECIEKARAYYPNKHFPMPSINYGVRGTVAGQADMQQWQVRFNSVLLVENEEDFLENTVPHEVAHLVDFVVNPDNFKSDVVIRRGRYRRTKRSVHGPTFKFIMKRVLGAADNSRCHTYDTSAAKVKNTTKYVWVSQEDPSVTMALGPKRHKKQLVQANLGRRGYYPRGYSTHTFCFSHIEGQEPGVQIKAAAHEVNPRARTGKSKLDLCRAAFNSNNTRVKNIEEFINLGCTPAGAATYYAKIKKELKNG